MGSAFRETDKTVSLKQYNCLFPCTDRFGLVELTGASTGNGVILSVVLKNRRNASLHTKNVQLNAGMRIWFWPKKRIRGSNEGSFLKVFYANILYNFKTIFFVSILLVSVRRTIDLLDSETSPDPVKYGPDPDPGL